MALRKVKSKINMAYFALGLKACILNVLIQEVYCHSPVSPWEFFTHAMPEVQTFQCKVYKGEWSPPSLLSCLGNHSPHRFKLEAH